MKPYFDQSEAPQAPLAGHFSKRPTRRRGIALILVLAALLMIGALVLSFLSSVTNDENNNATPVGRIMSSPRWVLMNEVPARLCLQVSAGILPALAPAVMSRRREAASPYR